MSGTGGATRPTTRAARGSRAGAATRPLHGSCPPSSLCRRSRARGCSSRGSPPTRPAKGRPIAWPASSRIDALERSGENMEKRLENKRLLDLESARDRDRSTAGTQPRPAKKFSIRQALPGDPIFTRGYVIGGGTTARSSRTTTSARKREKPE